MWIKSLFDGIISLLSVFADIIKNDKVLIPILVFLILVVAMYWFKIDAKEIVLTGLGYLAGATQGSRTRGTDIPTNGKQT
jgi:hypothetical protein